tara:strand:- start:1 stop:198 length:198 start_codon:yes stop_codon:yes gene_type:complete
MNNKYIANILVNTKDIELLITRYCEQQQQIVGLEDKIDKLISLLIDLQLSQETMLCVKKKTYGAD